MMIGDNFDSDFKKLVPYYKSWCAELIIKVTAKKLVS